jgi:aminoglycoside phosphotransferase (APT) family kinase protein
VAEINWLQLEQVVNRIQPSSNLIRAWELPGGVSAQVIALEIAHMDGATQKLVVRLHGEIDRAQNPNIAADEFKLLNHLYNARLPVPKPLFVDDSGEIFPIPYIVVEYIDGVSGISDLLLPDQRPDMIRQLATTLAQIHSTTAIDALTFLPRHDAACTEKLRVRPSVLDTSLQEDRIRDTLEAVWPLKAMNKTALLHGDYWPGNTMWRGDHQDQIVVIDWEDAVLGDPVADLGKSRLEILWAFGIDGMHIYTQHYQRLMPDLDYSLLPYWDLFAALRPAGKIAEWAGSAERERVMRERHAWFVERAYEAVK